MSDIRGPVLEHHHMCVTLIFLPDVPSGPSLLTTLDFGQLRTSLTFSISVVAVVIEAVLIIILAVIVKTLGLGLRLGICCGEDQQRLRQEEKKYPGLRN